MIFTIIFYKKGRLCLLNLQSKWVNFLKPTYVSDEIKEKTTSYNIFFYNLWFILFTRFISNMF